MKPTQSTNFQDIVKTFDKIENVVNHNKKSAFTVTGVIDGQVQYKEYTYNHLQVMIEVSNKVKQFIGI